MPIEDILNTSITETISLINQSHSEYIDVDFVACIQHTELIFSKRFLTLLESVNLELIPWSISFSSSPGILGLIHCDYYEDLDKRADSKPGNIYYTNYNMFYKTSLHIDLLGVGTLEWFNLSTELSTLVQTDKTNLPWYKINQGANHLDKIDSLSGIGVNLCATDIPHRANNLSNDCQRLVLTGRFKNNPNIDEVNAKLHSLSN